jgi:hypothetical protein
VLASHFEFVDLGRRVKGLARLAGRASPGDHLGGRLVHTDPEGVLDHQIALDLDIAARLTGGRWPWALNAWISPGSDP